MNKKLKLAIIGTNGIPANYGGFETLVEYLAENLAVEFDITVFCSAKFYKEKLATYKGVSLKYISLNANGWQSIFFDFVSLLRSYKSYDKILILGCSGSVFQPIFFLYKRKFIMNLGGLDWQRSKWNFFTRKYLKFSEKLGVKFSGQLVSDNLGIREYLLNQYGIDSVVIPYGGDHVVKYSIDQENMLKYPFLNYKFALAVARIQPDNNIEMLCDAFILETPFPLVIIGNWNNSQFGIQLKNKYVAHKNLILLDAIYNQRELNIIRSNCFVYIHGHSAGGTNPALVEAMSLELPIIAFDNNFNRHTTQYSSYYFTNFTNLNQMICEINEFDLKIISRKMYLIAKSKYTWRKVCSDYATIVNKT
jgi:glycosyltransferase involved in cell wall biosynthesis